METIASEGKGKRKQQAENVTVLHPLVQLLCIIAAGVEAMFMVMALDLSSGENICHNLGFY